jgi:hypothetical protein
MRRALRGLGRCATVGLGMVLATLCIERAAGARDLGDILVQKGLITPEELTQAREEEKQKAAAEESRRDAITAKLPKWLAMITPFGDVRVRDEGFYANDLNGRTRFRLRARLGLKANVSDEVAATVRLASGNADDPISTNQTFERTFTRKPINLDQAYLTLKPGKSLGLEPGWMTLTGGKFGVNAYRVSELVWDDDLSPEGATETLNLVDQQEGLLRSLNVNAFQWVVDEVSSAGDPWMGGGQVVADTVLGDNGPKLTVAFADYNFNGLNKVARKYLNQYNDPPTNSKPNSSYNSQLANSNSVARDANGKIVGYKSGFNIVNGGGELNFSDVFGVAAGLFGEVAYNTEADSRSTGFATGVGIGKAGRDWYHNGLTNPGDWAISYTYERVAKDAVYAVFSYSDLDYVRAKATQKGSTNLSASILRLDYVLLPHLQLTAKAHFINALDRKASNAALDGNDTLFRTQLDAMLKF